MHNDYVTSTKSTKSTKKYKSKQKYSIIFRLDFKLLNLKSFQVMRIA